MRLLREALRLVWEGVWFGAASRRIFLPLLLIAGVVAIVVVVTVQVVAPLVLYPML